MYIIGLNVYHGDASACLFKDGNLIFAAEEERYTRIKHAAGFPLNAIKNCLDSENITLEQVDFITLNRNPKNRIIQKFLYAIKNPLRIKNFFGELIDWKNLDDLIPKNFKLGKKFKKTGKAGIFAGSLELVKEGNLKIKQNKLFDDIYIRKNT